MAILSGNTIRRKIKNDEIGISPEYNEDQVQPASLDIRLGKSYINEKEGKINKNCEEVVIKPDTFYLGHTMDTVSLPNDISAMVSGRSSLARKGLIIHTTAGWIDAGFNGEITLEIYNFNSNKIKLQPGQRVGQLVFFEMDEPADISYGEKDDAKYQNQTGPTESRID